MQFEVSSLPVYLLLASVQRLTGSLTAALFFCFYRGTAAGSASSVERRCNGCESVTLDAGSEGKGAFSGRVAVNDPVVIDLRMQKA